ncbi:hypothetical protein L211DRAFT_859988 [Terfezia boudieri ATCC MYA-4762]|uniref:tRNA(Phe) (4-demethylwyosine(37)-C(7)) aminocarboxypropyltransferase n=1 Tax=Terfezia boudieri ATCC MYA-4762 TaxID=1051890 RepID=A0A3N4M660_9PEZI|nr:hypothetical protein L211DRAFT_859988 [Terfezia boudieri ATCC MYA-4762]
MSTLDPSHTQTLALLTPRRLVKAVKTLLESQGLWGKQIEAMTKPVDVGGSGLGVGEEMYLVYSSLSRDGDEGEEYCAEENGDEAGGSSEGGEAKVVVDERLGSDLAVLVKEGHVQAEWVRNEIATATPTTATASTATIRLRQQVRRFLEDHPPPPPSPSPVDVGGATDTDVDSAREFLISTLPKRWSYYPPLVLLLPTAFTSPQWEAYLASLSDDQRTEFYTTFTTAIHPKATHLAINAPIPPTTTAALAALTSSLNSTTITPTPPTTPPTRSSNSNTLRSPANLTPLLGLFGPLPPALPTPATLPFTLFTTTTQLSIHQTWAPLHTMFSRGNISEKSRILTPTFPGARAILNSLTLDLYAGIGYFSFCYLRAGAGVVLCWELNPWSVEGLVRGMQRNGFGGVMVVGEQEETPAVELGEEGGPRVLVFNEDNKHAGRRLLELRGKGKGKGLPVKHVNLGLLPASQGGYRVAVEAILIGDGNVLEGETVGWAHVHENVAVGEEEEKGEEVKREFGRLVREVGGEKGGVELDGEKGGFRVKTYAPGVVHVVYDVKIWR